jgi:hypothetical protein
MFPVPRHSSVAVTASAAIRRTYIHRFSKILTDDLMIYRTSSACKRIAACLMRAHNAKYKGPDMLF